MSGVGVGGWHPSASARRPSLRSAVGCLRKTKDKIRQNNTQDEIDITTLREPYLPYSTPLWNRFGAVLGCFCRLRREILISQNWLKGQNMATMRSAVGCLHLRGTKGVPRKGVWTSVDMWVWTCKESGRRHDQTNCYDPHSLGPP